MLARGPRRTSSQRVLRPNGFQPANVHRNGTPADRPPETPNRCPNPAALRRAPRTRRPRGPICPVANVPRPQRARGFAQAVPSSNTAFKAVADLVFIEVAADEHDPALAPLARLPRPLVVAVEDHVHALEHEALGIVLERHDALGAQDARSVLGDEVLHPREELVGIERLVGLQRQRLHLLVVIVLHTVTMVVPMIIAVMIVIM